MINILLEVNKKGVLIFRANIDKIHKENLIIKRCLFESKIIKSNRKYPYNIPMKFLLPIINNFHKKYIYFDENSISEFLEFSDEYDDKYYYSYKANASYMKKWREEFCPKIYKVIIDKNKISINKNIIFERFI
ncbi:hypothetical protein [Clostridium tarantellae]|uniref:Uncharacterized protein n=1 Tax=Clostridium tarantellae TaxID=39493 RepID=A0A6I1MQN3_9CLOT|nr:hypothetical protein [Clostridium tarantellae]MPQ45113.1 hypothetical protein [Clostridium tarantellae]